MLTTVKFTWCPFGLGTRRTYIFQLKSRKVNFCANKLYKKFLKNWKNIISSETICKDHDVSDLMFLTELEAFGNKKCHIMDFTLWGLQKFQIFANDSQKNLFVNVERHSLLWNNFDCRYRPSFIQFYQPNEEETAMISPKIQFNRNSVQNFRRHLAKKYLLTNIVNAHSFLECSVIDWCENVCFFKVFAKIKVKACFFLLRIQKYQLLW